MDQSGGWAQWGLKKPHSASGPLFFMFFRQFKEKKAKPFLPLLPWGYPPCQAWPAHGWFRVWALEVHQIWVQNRGSGIFMLSVKPCQRKIATDEIKKEESSNIKVCGSVHWQAQGHAKWQRGWREAKHLARIETMPSDSLWLVLTTKP